MRKFEQIVVSTAAIGVTASMLTSGNHEVSHAVITVEDGSIRYRIDGGNPTGSVGHLANAGDQIELESYEEVLNFKAIRDAGSDGTLNVTYKYGGV